VFCGVECEDAGFVGKLESRSYSGGDHGIHDAVERCQQLPVFRVPNTDNVLETIETISVVSQWAVRQVRYC